jgi:Flp pilus assembly protein TadG
MSLNRTRLCAARTRRSAQPRRGAIVVLTAVLLIVLMSLLALSIDTGYMYTMQTELDRSVDAAALAGASSLIESVPLANSKVVEYLVRNPVGGGGTLSEVELPTAVTTFLNEHQNDFEIVSGEWDPVLGQFSPNSEIPSAISVSMRYPNLPLFFGRVLGKDSFSVQSSAIAMYQPRDIVLVLDFSGSMNDDSELKSIGAMGYDVIIENLRQINTELGSPQYGIMEFDPDYITVEGAPPTSPDMPQNAVEYQYTSVEVNSTKDLNRVVLRYSNGNYEYFSYLSGTSGTFAGTGSNAGKAIYEVYVRTDTYDSYEWFDFRSTTIRSTIKSALGLDGVSYPYASGSWESFIDYCRNNSTNRDAGFRYKFGNANLINYWLEQKPSSYETADLWKVSAQPVTAVKDSVGVFMEYIQEVDTNDRVGLAMYNAPDGEGLVEVGLTTDFSVVSDTARHRQAGHYHNYTNIGAGMLAAREELEANGRAGAFRMIVLMTDGQTNWHNGAYDTTGARNQVIQEAYAAAALNFPIVTISLGAGADVGLMAQVAEITESRHFNVPGGQQVSEYRAGLFQVFKDIADNRPLKLVH